MKTTMTVLRLLAPVWPMLLLAGCVNAPIQGRSDPYDAAQIHFDSDELRNDTAIGKPLVNRDEYGLVHVMVPIRSAINKQLYVEYRVSFFDRNHSLLDQQGWQTKTLTANTPDQVEFNSSDRRAVDFQIDFRYPPGYLGPLE